MIRRPPRATRTDTLLPYTAIFRSVHAPGNRLLFLAGRDAGVSLDAALGFTEEFHSCHFSAPPLTPALRGKVWFCFPACRSPRRSRRCQPCCWTHPRHRDRRPSDTCDGDRKSVV